MDHAQILVTRDFAISSQAETITAEKDAAIRVKLALEEQKVCVHL